MDDVVALRYEYKRNGRATGRLLVTDQKGQTVLHDQINLDAEKKRAEVAEVLRKQVSDLNRDDVLAELSRLALAVPPEGSHPDPSERQGQRLALSDPEPWPEAVDGAEVLDELTATFSRFLVLPEGAATACALWVMHAHAHDAFEVSPLLAITSPEKRCGKTTLLELGTALVPRPLPASSVTTAVLFRAVEKFRPTLLADEMDAFFGRNNELRGILNSGHRRSFARVLRSVGDDFEPRCFATWSPKILALIGRLPDTLADRSIPVRMRRKRKGERAERLRLDRLGELEPTRRRAWSWAQASFQALASADPAVPPELNDRAADNWRPLLAIADLAGGPWPERARRAAILLSSDREDDNSAAVLLLGDLKRLYENREADRLSSAEIVAALLEMEYRPWPEWRNGKPITRQQLATLLRPFDIVPKSLWIGERTVRGYELGALEDAFSRYLRGAGVQGVQESSNGAADEGFSGCKETLSPCTLKNAGNPHGSATLAPLSPEDGEDAAYLADERAGMMMR